MCPVGTYQRAAGSLARANPACLDCPPDTSSEQAAAACHVACGAGRYARQVDDTEPAGVTVKCTGECFGLSREVCSFSESGETKIFHDTSGNISSGFGVRESGHYVYSEGGNYPRDANCKWTLQSTQTITFSFSSIDTTKNWDFVEVYVCTDDTCYTKNLIARFSGKCFVNEPECDSHLGLDDSGVYTTTPAYPVLQVRLSTAGHTNSIGLGFVGFWSTATEGCESCAAGFFRP